jgi:hypothetical protein
MSRVQVSDDALRNALQPGPEVVPPADFVDLVALGIAGQPQGSWLWSVVGVPTARSVSLAGRMLLLLVLLLVLLVGALVIGSPSGPRGAGGSLYVADAGELLMIDAQTGATTSLLAFDADVAGVARSTRGDFVSFWTGAQQNVLEIVRADGTGLRQVAANLAPAASYRGGIDVWSGDDRYLVSGVSVGDAHRILVVDVASGEGRLIGPADGAENPLISPDGQWVAFVHETSSRTLAVMHPDGSAMRDISPAGTAHISGPVNWSPDGRWVYFDNAGQVRRANVEDGVVERLTRGDFAAAPALSPGGDQVAYLVWSPDGGGKADIHLMDADGSSSQLLLKAADLRGWSADGHYILAVVSLAGGAAELVAIAPDGSGQHTLMHVDRCAGDCFQNMSSGVPRP